MSNIDDFKGQLEGGGARANLFELNMPNPASIGFDINQERLSFMCKGAQLPASVVAQIDVPYRGRQLKVAGDRTFENWTITVFNENSQLLRSGFESWMNSLNNHEENKGEMNPLLYMVDLEINQLDRKGEQTKRYQLKGAFPVNVSAIDLSYDANDAIEEFTVEFAYQYWTTGTGKSLTGITT